MHLLTGSSALMLIGYAPRPLGLMKFEILMMKLPDSGLRLLGTPLMSLRVFEPVTVQIAAVSSPVTA